MLELGCGHGLPGIVALMAGAEVHFQVGGGAAGYARMCVCMLCGLAMSWVQAVGRWADREGRGAAGWGTAGRGRAGRGGGRAERGGGG